MGETVRFFAVGYWALCRGQTNPLPQTDASTAKGLGKYGKESMEVRQRVVASTAKGFAGGLNPLDPARRLPRHFTYWWRMSIYRPRDLLRAITRPPWRFRSIDLGGLVYRLGGSRSTDLGFSVDRPGDFGGPTAALRSTDMANSVYRLCLPPGNLVGRPQCLSVLPRQMGGWLSIH